MPAAIEVTEPELSKRLDALALEGVNLDPLFRRIFVAIEAETKRRFATSTAPDGTPWAPLVLRRGKPLYDTGKLALSVTAGATKTMTGHGLTYGTNNEIAHVHQDGMTIRPKKGRFLMVPLPGKKGKKSGRFLFLKQAVIPARPFLGWNDKMTETCLDLTADFVIEQLGK